MTDRRVQMLLERNRNFNTPLSPPALADVRKKIRGSGAGGLVILILASFQSSTSVLTEAVCLTFYVRNNGDNVSMANPVCDLSEAAIIRNAGGRASDALRSIATLDAIAGVAAIIVVHHTDCGTTLVLDEEVREMLKKRAPEKSAEIDEMAFGEITNVDESIKEDIALLESWPFLGKETKILGFNLDVKSGLLTEVKS